MTTRLRRLLGEPWLFFLLATHMFGQAGIYLVRPMVSYRALSLGVEPASLGFLSAAFSMAPLVVALWLGRMVDRRGELRFILVGNAMMVAAGFALALTDSVAPLFVMYAILGLGHLVVVVAAQAMVARGSDESGYDQRFAAFSFAGSIGQFAGPAIAGAVAGQGSVEETVRALFVGAVVLALTLPAAFLIRPPAHVRPARGHGAVRTGSLMQILRTPGVARAILVSTTVLSTIDIMTVYMPALGEDRLWPASLVGALLAIRAAASMGVRLVLGRMAARFGRGRLLITSMAVAAVSLILIPFAGAVPIVAFLMVTSGAGLGIGQPMTMAWVAALASPGTRATALGVRLMGNRVGQVALPIAVGSFAAVAGAAGVIGALGLVVAGSLAIAAGGLDWRTPSGRARAEAQRAAQTPPAAPPPGDHS